jgi:hypothetical protein
MFSEDNTIAYVGYSRRAMAKYGVCSRMLEMSKVQACLVQGGRHEGENKSEQFVGYIISMYVSHVHALRSVRTE